MTKRFITRLDGLQIVCWPAFIEGEKKKTTKSLLTHTACMIACSVSYGDVYEGFNKVSHGFICFRSLLNQYFLRFPGLVLTLCKRVLLRDKREREQPTVCFCFWFGYIHRARSDALRHWRWRGCGEQVIHVFKPVAMTSWWQTQSNLRICSNAKQCFLISFSNGWIDRWVESMNI